MSERTVVFLAGLSGVGKSTLLQTAKRKIAFEYLNASQLILAERQHRAGSPTSQDSLRDLNIDENQDLLISGFLKRAPEEGLIVLDGHTLIDSPDGPVEIPPSVFSAIGVSRFVVLVDGVEDIAFRRLADTRRVRPARSHDELARHQEWSLVAAFRAALALGVPLYIVPFSQRMDIVRFIES